MLTYREFLEFKAKAVNPATHQDPVVRLGYEITYGGLVRFGLKIETPQQLIADLRNLQMFTDHIEYAVLKSASDYLEYLHQHQLLDS